MRLREDEVEQLLVRERDQRIHHLPERRDTRHRDADPQIAHVIAIRFATLPNACAQDDFQLGSSFSNAARTASFSSGVPTVIRRKPGSRNASPDRTAMPSLSKST